MVLRASPSRSRKLCSTAIGDTESAVPWFTVNCTESSMYCMLLGAGAGAAPLLLSDCDASGEALVRIACGKATTPSELGAAVAGYTAVMSGTYLQKHRQGIL